MSSRTTKLQFRPTYCNFPLNLDITSNTPDFLLNFGKGKFRERSSNYKPVANAQTSKSSKIKASSKDSCECFLDSKQLKTTVDEDDTEECFGLSQEIDLTNEVEMIHF